VRACGRTDAGVSSIGQICRVRTGRTPTEVPLRAVAAALELENPSVVAGGCENDLALRCLSVREEGRAFHPKFGARCRSYIYLWDLSEENEENGPFALREEHVRAVDAMLRKLTEAGPLDYVAASYGRTRTETTACRLLWDRAFPVDLLPDDREDARRGNDAPGGRRSVSRGADAMCVELIGDRFLRRMVRILVAIVVREAVREARKAEGTSEAAGCGGEDALLNIVLSKKKEPMCQACGSGGPYFCLRSFWRSRAMRRSVQCRKTVRRSCPRRRRSISSRRLRAWIEAI